MWLILIFFSLDPQGSKSDGTHKKGTSFLFIQVYTSLLIHSGDVPSEKWREDHFLAEFKMSVCFIKAVL